MFQKLYLDQETVGTLNERGALCRNRMEGRFQRNMIIDLWFVGIVYSTRCIYMKVKITCYGWHDVLPDWVTNSEHYIIWTELWYCALQQCSWSVHCYYYFNCPSDVTLKTTDQVDTSANTLKRKLIHLRTLSILNCAAAKKAPYKVGCWIKRVPGSGSKVLFKFLFALKFLFLINNTRQVAGT